MNKHKSSKLWSASDIKPMSSNEGVAAYHKILKNATTYRHNAVKKIPGKAL